MMIFRAIAALPLIAAAASHFAATFISYCHYYFLSFSLAHIAAFFGFSYWPLAASFIAGFHRPLPR